MSSHVTVSVTTLHMDRRSKEVSRKASTFELLDYPRDPHEEDYSLGDSDGPRFNGAKGQRGEYEEGQISLRPAWRWSTQC